MRAWVERHPLTAYFMLAYACSWSIALPLALQAQGVLGTHLPWALHYLTAFGPAIAATAVAGFLQKPVSKSAERNGSARSLKWWLVGFGSPLLLFAVACLAAYAVGRMPPTLSALGRVNFLPHLGLGAWLLWFLTSGCGEELGWRGFALPRLQANHSALTSSVLLSIGWAGWHIPAFFYVPSYAAIGLSVVPGFFLGILAGAIVLTWLYNSSGGSVLAAVLWHASFNWVTASPNAAGLVAAVTSTLVMVWAIVLVWRYGPATLTSGPAPASSVLASRGEKARTLPGDELISEPIGSLTHAVTIRRAPHQVWPWLAQMGAGSRAGWYSYDWIDNRGKRSALQIVPELQNIAVGMVLPALPGVTDCFVVASFEPERSLVVGWPSEDGGWRMTWAFVLEELEHGSTRLIVRARGGADYRFHGLPWWLIKAIVRPGHFIMLRKQLLGIAWRAEHQTA